jgi:hypothetical protein
MASKVVFGLRPRGSAIWRQTFRLLHQESPEYRNSVDEEFINESRTNCGELSNTLISIPNGRADQNDAGSFDFVPAHAVWRARRHFWPSTRPTPMTSADFQPITRL